MWASLSQFAGGLTCSKVLFLINLVVFVLMLASDGWHGVFFIKPELLYAWGANIGAFTVQGQYWRLISCLFVHGGILHLALNMYALVAFGPSVEAVFGQARFLLIYLLSGICGGLASMLWNPTQTSVGASSALMGTAGALLASLISQAGKSKKSDRFHYPFVFLAIICASFLGGFFTPELDNAAHIGGFAGGLVCGLILLPDEKNNRSDRISLYARFALLLLFMLVVSTVSVQATISDRRSQTYRIAASAIKYLRASEYQKAYEEYDSLLKSELTASFFVGRGAALIGLKKFEAAVNDANRAIALNKKDNSAYLTRARAFHELGQYSKAVADLTRVIEESPKQASAYNSRAWSLAAAGQYERALVDANKAIELDSSMHEAFDTRGVIYYCLKKYHLAMNDFEKAILLDSSDAASHYHLALIYKKVGEERKAGLENKEAERFAYEPEPWEKEI